jgi:hypothetical protein
MSTQLLPRFTLRLLVPALALSAIALLGEPLPAPAQAAMPPMMQIQIHEESLALALRQEAETLRQEAQAAKKAARQTASQMRWFLTLPAAGPRCSTPGCAS